MPFKVASLATATVIVAAIAAGMLAFDSRAEAATWYDYFQGSCAHGYFCGGSNQPLNYKAGGYAEVTHLGTAFVARSRFYDHTGKLLFRAEGPAWVWQFNPNQVGRYRCGGTVSGTSGWSSYPMYCQYYRYDSSGEVRSTPHIRTTSMEACSRVGPAPTARASKMGSFRKTLGRGKTTGDISTAVPWKSVTISHTTARQSRRSTTRIDVSSSVQFPEEQRAILRALLLAPSG